MASPSVPLIAAFTGNHPSAAFGVFAQLARLTAS
jgi:hypothetical protein